MPEPIKLYLVRHGQTDLNRDKRFRGLSDVSLNEQGLYEAAGAAKLLLGAGLARILTSPVTRAAQTATAIAVTTGARVETDDDLTDVDYGDWQGLTVEEVAERSGTEQLTAWRADPASFAFPNGEAMSSVADRLKPALLRAVGGEGPVAVVSHLAILKVCFCVLMDVDLGYFWRVDLDNGAVSVFAHTPGGGFTLDSWNMAPSGQGCS
jgi:ribonuclease H / adenosylcobalamin/alpha-ribazole phosphatase